MSVSTDCLQTKPTYHTLSEKLLDLKLLGRAMFSKAIALSPLLYPCKGDKDKDNAYFKLLGQTQVQPSDYVNKKRV